MTCVCMASLSPRNSLCQNFTCVFDSVDSPYCACNLCQISLGPFSLVRNFITTHCAIVIGTSLSLILNSSEEKGESDREVRRVPTLHHTAAQGHYQTVLIRWLQLTEVDLYLIYLYICFPPTTQITLLLLCFAVYVIWISMIHIMYGPMFIRSSLIKKGNLSR